MLNVHCVINLGKKKRYFKHRIEKHPIRIDFSQNIMKREFILIKDFEKKFLSNLIEFVSYPSWVKANIDFDFELLKNVSILQLIWRMERQLFWIQIKNMLI